MSTESRSVRAEALVLAAVLAATTAVFWTTRLDLAAADAFRTPCCSWPVGERPLWSAVYRYGVLFGVLLAAGALVTFTLSWWFPARLARLRRPALFLVLAAALGPGLTINVVLKDHWGRPRPREVVELGGQERYLPPGQMGSDRQLKSFPCGHCSMGFYLGVPWLVLRRRRRALGYAALAAGLGWGGMLGAARMAAGGHFLSDVLWAGAATWGVALLLHRLLDPEREEAPPTPEELLRQRGKARLMTLLGGGALMALTVAVLVATPYLSEKTWRRDAAAVAASPASAWQVVLDQAAVSLEAGPDLEATYAVQAFGFPTSRVGWSFAEPPGAPATLSIDRQGFFTERRTTVRLRWPAGAATPLRLALGEGKVRLDLTGFGPAARLEVAVEAGEVRVKGVAALRDGRARVTVARGRVIEEE